MKIEKLSYSQMNGHRWEIKIIADSRQIWFSRSSKAKAHNPFGMLSYISSLNTLEDHLRLVSWVKGLPICRFTVIIDAILDTAVLGYGTVQNLNRASRRLEDLGYHNIKMPSFG